jgi:hypothetical protein
MDVKAKGQANRDNDFRGNVFFVKTRPYRPFTATEP